MIVTKNNIGLAIVWEEGQTPPDGTPYLEIEELPEGNGALKTDLQTVWWEAPEPAPVPEPTPDEDVDELLVDMDYRLTLLELGLNE